MAAFDVSRNRWWFTVLVISTFISVNVAFKIEEWSSLAGQLRLVSGNSDLDGMVEVLINDEWRRVCGQNWTLASGHAVCQQLGYSGGAALAHTTQLPTAEASLEPVFIDVVPCTEADGQYTDCEDNVSSGDDWCNTLEVAWVKCFPHVPLFEDLQTMPQALHMDTEPTARVQPVASDIDGASVTLDWTDWSTQIATDDLFIIRFVIKYRLADNDAVLEYEIAAKLPSYNTRRTITDLQERTKYEFIIEAVVLGENGEEEVGPVTQPLIVNMPCGAPSQVINPVVRPQNGTGRVLEVSWERPADPDCPPSSYIVEYQLTGVGKCDDLSSSRVTPEDTVLHAQTTTATQFRIVGLHPYSTYTVYVTSRNDHGHSQKWHDTVMTNEDAPSAKPTGITAEYRYVSGKKRLSFSWDPIPCGDRSGEIIGYTYILLDITTDQVTNTGETSGTSLELIVSHTVRQYKFLVAAKTRAGQGEYAAFSVDAQLKISDICGRTIMSDSDSVQRIVSGATARKGSAPWLAQLWYTDKGTLFCHGSILDDRWILTAAHCIRSRNTTKNNLQILLGDFDKHLPEMEEQAYTVDEIIVHSGFDTKLFDSDIALVKVSKPIQFTDYIRPICLPQKKLSRDMLSVGRQGVVSGWGKLTTNDDEYPRYLKKVPLPVQNQTICKRSTTYTVTPNMFCAGYTRAGMGDSCEGDSGAPFAVQHHNGRWYVLGVVSWGEGCDQQNKFGFYVRLHRYTAWIKRQTKLELR